MKTQYKYKKEKFKGISLLEILVALAIMAISVVIIYRAIAGVIIAAQAIKDNGKVQIIATSLLDRYQYIGEKGINESSFDGDFNWEAWSEPFFFAQENEKITLYTLKIKINNNKKVWIFETLRPSFSEINKEVLR